MEKKQARYIVLQKKLKNRKKISESKQKNVEWREECFIAFGIFYKNCQKYDSNMSMHRAAIKFFSSPDNSAVRNQWKDAKSFYNSYTKRNQDPEKK